MAFLPPLVWKARWLLMDYIYTVIANFRNLEGFYRLWLQAAATYVLFGLAVDLATLLFFKE